MPKVIPNRKERREASKKAGGFSRKGTVLHKIGGLVAFNTIGRQV